MHYKKENFIPIPPVFNTFLIPLPDDKVHFSSVLCLLSSDTPIPPVFYIFCVAFVEERDAGASGLHSRMERGNEICSILCPLSFILCLLQPIPPFFYIFFCVVRR